MAGKFDFVWVHQPHAIQCFVVQYSTYSGFAIVVDLRVLASSHMSFDFAVVVSDSTVQCFVRLLLTRFVDDLLVDVSCLCCTVQYSVLGDYFDVSAR